MSKTCSIIRATYAMLLKMIDCTLPPQQPHPCLVSSPFNFHRMRHVIEYLNNIFCPGSQAATHVFIVPRFIGFDTSRFLRQIFHTEKGNLARRRQHSKLNFDKQSFNLYFMPILHLQTTLCKHFDEQ